MPRHIRMVEGIYGMYEDFAFAIGDAEDFVERERIRIRELMDYIADGSTSTAAAKREVNHIFANASKQIREARELAAGNAMRAGFPHLHAALIREDTPTALPLAFRVVVPIPEGAA